MKKKCELCASRANTYCESDQANLCWSCDANVHSANFIVEKHSRTLLCHICQSFTPWTATGRKLSPTISVCQSCLNAQNNVADNHQDSSDGYRRDDDDNNDDENQVVPLSPPPVSSSSK
ncbi:zinc finger protein CONSTANS-LIKE 9-like [Cucurbita maxima]|uniref:Zinc finger protein CONSTANS-LIKE 9-like n=1 Tax=Cucurbita maxima TaxID=3661 RepID=A0A6J1JY69_CUCMA|nr:zinc finger protein CONSTANS-LIKE 9-like [Cucurbita maxima]